MTSFQGGVAPVELVRLHRDIFRLLHQLVSMGPNTQKYLEIKWGPRCDRVSDLLRDEAFLKSMGIKWQEHPGPKEELAPDFMEKMSEEIDRMLALASSIDDRNELFDWFAVAYLEWPSEIPYYAGQASRHYVVATTAIKDARCVDEVRRKGWPDAMPKALILKESYQRREERRRRPDCFNCLIRDEPALNEELSRAVRICISRMGQPVDPRDAERDEWLYRQWQELNNPWSQILVEYEEI